MAIDIDNYKFYVRGLSISDEDLKRIVNTVIGDIAKTTNIFKSIVGFSILKEIADYDFNLILKINNTIRTEASSVHIGNYTEQQILDYFKHYDSDSFPSPDVSIEESTNKINEIFLSVCDIVIENNYNYKSIFDKFSFFNGSIFQLKDKTVFDINVNSVQAVAIISVIPDINHLQDDIISIIEPAIIEGIKYFTHNAYIGSDDNQTSYELIKRYNEEKNRLLNMYPTTDGKIHKGAWL